MIAQAAAELLGTSPTILTLWERRFGYPVPVRSDDGEWQYPDDAMIALRDALGRELSITLAITSARQAQPKTASAGLNLRRPETSEEGR
jgi:hypothetical protein